MHERWTAWFIRSPQNRRLPVPPILSKPILTMNFRTGPKHLAEHQGSEHKGRNGGQTTRRELFDRPWPKPVTINAAELGANAAALAKLARPPGLRLPGSGHWTKKEVARNRPFRPNPASLRRDARFYSIPVSSRRRPIPATGSTGTDAAGTTGPTIASERQDTMATRLSEYEKVSSTLLESRVTDRASIRGRANFRRSATVSVAIAGRTLARPVRSSFA